MKSWLVDIVSALVAYVVARWIFSGRGGVFENLHFELAVFAGLYGLLQLLIRGYGLHRKGRE